MDEKKKNLRITKSAVVLSIVSIIAIIFSFGKESVIAYYYGTSAYTDAYNISVDTPRIIFTFVSMAISTVVVPVYTKALVESDSMYTEYFFRNFTTMVVLSYLVLFLLSEISACFIIKILAPGLENNTVYLTTLLFRVTIPAIGLGLFCKINTGVLNCHKDFLLPSLAPILFNLSVAICVISFAGKIGIYATTIGTIAGMILEFVFTCILRKKYVRYKPVLNLHDTATLSALRMAGPVFVGMSAAEMNLIVDKIIASFFEAGSISALNYASKLSNGISTLFIANITTVIFPELAEYVANKQNEKAAGIYIFSIKIFIILLVPIIVGGIFLGREIMTLVYGRGKFDYNTVTATTPIFVCYFISLIFTGIRQVGTNFLYSYGDSKTAMINTVIGIGINIILDIILSKTIGVGGLALATTLSVAVISVLLMRAARRKNKSINYNKFGVLLFQVGIACCMMLITIWSLKKILISKGLYDLGIMRHILIFTISAVLIGACIYCAMLLLLKVNEIYCLLSIVRKKRKH